jgi:hypothetical protein
MMKSFIVPCLAALAAYAMVPAASAEPVRHAVPVATNAECAAAQQQARRSPTGELRIVHSACRSADSFSRNTVEYKMKAGPP